MNEKKKNKTSRTQAYARALEFGIKVSGLYQGFVFFFLVAAFIEGSAGDPFLSLKHLLATKIPITLSSFLAAGKEHAPREGNCILSEQQTSECKGC